MSRAQPVKLFSPGEYYALERDAAYKSDYYRGEIFAMAGGSIRHSNICSNIIREVGNRLKGSRCRAYDGNIRLKCGSTGLRTYPDVNVYCEQFEYDEEDASHQTVTNPTMLFEVLSPSTQSYDLGFKAENYRQIESLKAYLMVAQERPHIEMHVRQANGQWVLFEATGIDAVLSLSAIGIDLPLKEVYDGVDFATNEVGPIPPRG